jgi:tripartite-type tricarboxylate transporter receptor subunit TctC
MSRRLTRRPAEHGDVYALTRGPLVTAMLLALAAAPAHAQTWPARPIEMIVPFPAGGSVDVIARAVAGSLSEQLHQQVVVANRDGASGTLGFNALAGAAPDGYTLGAGPTTPIANAPHLVKGVRYSVDSFDYICHVFENAFTVTVAPDSRFKTARELIAFAADNPGKLSYGHSGNGTIPHLSVENLADALKLKFQPVPFRGESAVMPVLLKGDIDFAAAAVVTIRGQNFRPLLVFTDARHPALPELPTARELGVATSVPPGQNGLFAPKGLPAEIKATLERACADAVKSPGVLRALESTGQIVHYLTGPQFHALTAADYQFKGDLVRRLGLAVQ